MKKEPLLKKEVKQKMIVRFNNVDEYLEELEKEAAQGHIPRGIVRATSMYSPSKLSPNIHNLSVVSTFLSSPPHGRNADVYMVRLDKRCGQLWDLESQDQAVVEQAEQVHLKISQKCAALNLDLRSGLIEEEQ